MSAVDLLAAPDSAAVDRAIDAYALALRHRYGSKLKGMFLFGSRARGDFQPYSDVDIAVVLADSARERSQTRHLADLAYDVFLETGAEIQPWAFPETEWNDPEHSSSPGLIRSAKRDSRPISLS
jgi:antitoxin ChpS